MTHRIAFLPLGPILSLALLGCGGAGSGAGAQEGSAQSEEEAKEEFLATCTADCEQANEADACEDYCTCSMKELDSDPELQSMAEEASAGKGGAGELGSALMGRCGQRIFIESFAKGCAASCSEGGEVDQPTCLRLCRCVGRRLLEGHPGQEGMQYLLDALSTEAPQPKLEREISGHADTCVGQ